MATARALAESDELRKIRDYVIIDEVGRGAHGTVYRAYHERRPSEIVALKIIDDNASIDRLLVEPHLLSQLKHPNIIALRDYFIHAGKVVLAMEYVPGPDLSVYTQDRRFCADEARECLRQLAEGVAHAHAAGIVHSDLKPQNILVDPSGVTPRYVVADFGVSRIAEGVQLTRRIAGTCQFMAPEQLRGRGTMQSDLWALGAIAYLLLTGKLPFPGATLEELRKQILYSTPPLPEDLAHDDPALEQVIVRLLEKSVVDRTGSAADLVAALSRESREVAVVVTEETDAAAPWETSLYEEIRKRKRHIVIWALFASLPDVIPTLLSCVGCWVIYRGQARAQRMTTALGFAIVVLALGMIVVFSVVINILVGEDVAALTDVGVGVFGLFALPAAANFVKMRLAQRQLTLLSSLRGSGREEAIDVLGNYIAATPGDINIRRRYAEALVAAGRVAEAAVEARLILDVDPYNLSATLLLAHAYLDLGMLERCEQVCNGYLEVSGQCFEFEELKELATRRGRAA